MNDVNGNDSSVGSTKRESRSGKDSKVKMEPKTKRVSKVATELPDVEDKPKSAVNRKKVKSNTESTDKSVDMDTLWFEPDYIIGATDRWNGQVAFRFKVKNSDDTKFVPAKLANVLVPQMVIKFYEDHIIFL